MKHLGDITKVNGSMVETVNVIIRRIDGHAAFTKRYAETKGGTP